METNEEKGRRQSDAKTLFLKAVINFAKFITGERGELLEHTVGFGYVHTIRVLYNFEDFSFFVDIGQSPIGGNNVKICHHPGKQYEKAFVPVLDIWWQVEVGNAKMETFDSNKKWKNEFLRAIKRQKDKEFIAKQAAEYAKKRIYTQYEIEVRQQHLAEKNKSENKNEH